MIWIHNQSSLPAESAKSATSIQSLILALLFLFREEKLDWIFHESTLVFIRFLLKLRLSLYIMLFNILLFSDACPSMSFRKMIDLSDKNDLWLNCTMVISNFDLFLWKLSNMVMVLFLVFFLFHKGAFIYMLRMFECHFA